MIKKEKCVKREGASWNESSVNYVNNPMKSVYIISVTWSSSL